jgi:hypothetical protein
LMPPLSGCNWVSMTSTRGKTCITIWTKSHSFFYVWSGSTRCWYDTSQVYTQSNKRGIVRIAMHLFPCVSL